MADSDFDLLDTNRWGYEKEEGITEDVFGVLT